jgi:hypothetical protein
MASAVVRGFCGILGGAKPRSGFIQATNEIDASRATL